MGNFDHKGRAIVTLEALSQSRPCYDLFKEGLKAELKVPEGVSQGNLPGLWLLCSCGLSIGLDGGTNRRGSSRMSKRPWGGLEEGK